MSERPPELSSLVGDLARTVEELQTSLEPEARPPLRPPRPGELARFTSEVTIPALILVLETNVRALKLLQRTLRLAQGRDEGSQPNPARERAQALGRETLARLDDALADLQDAIEGRPGDENVRQLLDDARQLRSEIDERLSGGAGPPGWEPPADTQPTGDSTVDIDVESELQNIKDDLDDDGADDDANSD